MSRRICTIAFVLTAGCFLPRVKIDPDAGATADAGAEAEKDAPFETSSADAMPANDSGAFDAPSEAAISGPDGFGNPSRPYHGRMVGYLWSGISSYDVALRDFDWSRLTHLYLAYASPLPNTFYFVSQSNATIASVVAAAHAAG